MMMMNYLMRVLLHTLTGSQPFSLLFIFSSESCRCNNTEWNHNIYITSSKPLSLRYAESYSSLRYCL